MRRHRGWIWNETGCVFVGFCKNIFGNVSIITVTVIAYGRYIQVACNKAIDFPWSWQAISYIWIYSLAWSSAPLLGWNRYTLELHGLDCSLDQTSEDSSQVSFVLLFFLAFLVVPVSIITYCYGYMLYSIRMLRRRQNYQSVLKLQDYEIKVAKMCALMILPFLTFWMPSYIMSLLVMCGYEDIITPTAATVSSILAKLSTAANPFIYILTNKKFRQGFLKLFCLRCWRIRTMADGRKKLVGATVKMCNAGNRPKKRVIFSSSSVSSIVATGETDTKQSFEMTQNIYGTNVKIIYVQPLELPDVLH
ncbi:opsin-3 isoform X2 [Rhinoderma darwinii]|uniref:opsin-3 isoform X2 n=1 Tax=Rhinoderma darwinii TaxID=43563 RepID=UPI003F68125C